MRLLFFPVPLLSPDPFECSFSLFSSLLPTTTSCQGKLSNNDCSKHQPPLPARLSFTMEQDGERENERIVAASAAIRMTGVRILTAGTLSGKETSPGMSHLQPNLVENASSSPVAASLFYTFSCFLIGEPGARGEDG